MISAFIDFSVWIESEESNPTSLIQWMDIQTIPQIDEIRALA